MTDIVFEIIRLIIVGLILIGLVWGQYAHGIGRVKSWSLVVFGFVLIFFAAL